MAVGQHEPIAIRPDRILRVETHGAVPNRVHQGRQCHRRTGVAGFGLLNGVDRQGSDRVDRDLSEIVIRHGNVLSALRAYCPDSTEATLLSRRTWRGAPLNCAARNVSTRSQATSEPTVRPPIQMIFISSS